MRKEEIMILTVEQIEKRIKPLNNLSNPKEIAKELNILFQRHFGGKKTSNYPFRYQIYHKKKQFRVEFENSKDISLAEFIFKHCNPFCVFIVEKIIFREPAKN